MTDLAQWVVPLEIATHSYREAHDAHKLVHTIHSRVCHVRIFNQYPREDMTSGYDHAIREAIKKDVKQ